MKTGLTRIAAFLITVFAAATASATVSVDEIIRLHTAGLSDQSLLLVVSASDTPDTLSTQQLTQMIEAQVPDTVISALVSKADAVMEDWQPVNLEEAMKGRTVYTETEVNYVYPSWDVWYGYGGWGWCATPWYSSWYTPWYGHCAYPYGGLYAGYGWGGGWSVGFSIGWGYGYCAPYYAPYYGGGYCGWYDPWPGYDPYPGYGADPYDSYRVVDRVDYHSGPSRDQGRGAPGTPYRQDPSGETRTELSRMEGRNLTTVDRGGSTGNGKSVRDQGGVPATRSVDNLKRVNSSGTTKSTLTTADRGDGRYVLKGEDKKLRDASQGDGRTVDLFGQKKESGSSKSTGSGRTVASDESKSSVDLFARQSDKGKSIQAGSSKSTSPATGGRSVELFGKKDESAGTQPKEIHPATPKVLNDVAGNADRGTQQRSTDLTGRASEPSRKVSSTATGAASVGDQVNRYVKMKQAQRSTNGTRGNRSQASSTRMAQGPDRTAAPTSGARSATSSGSKPQAKPAEGSKAQPKAAAPSTKQSSPKSFSPKSSRSAGSFGSPSSRSGGTASGGGSRGGTRSGGGSARGGRR